MKKILIIQLSRIGDIIQTLPLQAAVKYEYPQSEITLMCVKEFSEIAVNFPHLHKVITVTAEKVHQLQQASPASDHNIQHIMNEIINSIGEQKFDLIINCNLESGIALLAANINHKKVSGRIFDPTIALKIESDWSKYLFALTRFRVLNFFNFANIFTAMADLRSFIKEPLYALSPQASKNALALLKKNGYRENKKLIAIQPGSSKKSRSWGLENFAVVANFLLQHDDIQLVITGSKSEAGLAASMAELLEYPHIDLTGQTSLAELPAVLSHCELMITNDTGPMHIANLVGTKLLVISLSTAYFAETAPYGYGHVLIHSDLSCYPCVPGQECSHLECITSIKPVAIAEIALRILNNNLKESLNLSGLGIYQTTILKNGMLAYYPINSHISRHFLLGFLNRILWESLLNIDSDYNYIHDVIKSIRQHPLFNSETSTILRSVDTYLSLLTQGNIVLQKVLKELKKANINRNTIDLLLSEFREIENKLAKDNNSIFPLYLMLKTGNIPQGGFIEMIENIHDIYQMTRRKLQDVKKLFEDRVINAI